jgi:hypothetical protein
MVMQNSIPEDEARKTWTRYSFLGYRQDDGLTIFPSVLRSIPVNEAHALALRHSTLFGGSIPVEDSSSRVSASPPFKPAPLSVPTSPAHTGVYNEPLASLRIGIIIHDTEFAGRVNNIATLLEANRQVRLLLHLTSGQKLIALKVLVKIKLHAAYRPREPSSH